MALLAARFRLMVTLTLGLVCQRLRVQRVLGIGRGLIAATPQPRRLCCAMAWCHSAVQPDDAQEQRRQAAECGDGLAQAAKKAKGPLEACVVQQPEARRSIQHSACPMWCHVCLYLCFLQVPTFSFQVGAQQLCYSKREGKLAKEKG